MSAFLCVVRRLNFPIVLVCLNQRFEHATRSFKIDSFIEFPAHLDMSPYLSSTIVRDRPGRQVAERKLSLYNWLEALHSLNSFIILKRQLPVTAASL